jgi:hypothetical protein
MVKGHLNVNQRSATNPEKNLSVQIKIDCLTIVGNKATIQGIITKANPETIQDQNGEDFPLVGEAASMSVIDGGNGNENDMASQLFITGARSTFCSEEFPPIMYRTTNVVVRGG